MKSTAIRCAWTLGALIIGGWAGYSLHSSRTVAVFMPANAAPKLDYLIAPESFSRVQNTKATLAGLSLQMRLQAQSGLVAEIKLPPGPVQQAGLQRILRGLETDAQDFSGTEQELDFIKDTLIVLNRAGQLERWTDVYLRALYEHPTHPMVVAYAAEAVRIGKSVGREELVLAGLSHMAEIPIEFDGKYKIMALLAEARASAVVTQGNSLRTLGRSGS